MTYQIRNEQISKTVFGILIVLMRVDVKNCSFDSITKKSCLVVSVKVECVFQKPSHFM